MSMRAKGLALVFAMMALWFTPALAGDPPKPEARAIIEQQFDAFARDDADGAYKLAAPGIQTLFPDADTFMAMVRGKYAAVYRHRSVDFGPFVDSDDEIQQAVYIVDNDNKVWTAIYRLAKQPDGTWKIGGCVLMLSEQSSL